MTLEEYVAQLSLDSDARRLISRNMKVALHKAGQALASGDLMEAARYLQIAGEPDHVFLGDNAVENVLYAWERE